MTVNREQYADDQLLVIMLQVHKPTIVWSRRFNETQAECRDEPNFRQHFSDNRARHVVSQTVY